MTKIISSEKPLVIPPQLATKIGRWEALILQQIHHHCQHSKHVIDGAKWFWKTLKDWAEEIPFISLGTIRRAIANLRDMGLILVERHSAKKTCYQANWYKPNYDAIRSLLADGCDRPEQIQAIEVSTSSIYTETNSSENLSTHTPPTPPKAVVGEKEEKYVPTPEELCAAERELRECRINPAAVMREVLRQFANFKGAIARTKEAQSQPWCTNPTGVFRKALRLGLGPDSPNFSRDSSDEIPEPPAGFIDWCKQQSEIKTAWYSRPISEWVAIYKTGVQRPWHEVMGVKI